MHVKFLQIYRLNTLIKLVQYSVFIFSAFVNHRQDFVVCFCLSARYAHAPNQYLTPLRSNLHQREAQKGFQIPLNKQIP